MSSKSKKNTKSKAQKNTKPAKQRAKYVSMKDVQLAYLLDGVGAVAKLAPAKASVRKAIKAIDALGRNTDALKAWATETFGQESEHRGRPSPKAGESRTYKVQEVKGARFLRLPLEALGVRKGSPVSVAFESGQITVKRAA